MLYARFYYPQVYTSNIRRSQHTQIFLLVFLKTSGNIHFFGVDQIFSDACWQPLTHFLTQCLGRSLLQIAANRILYLSEESHS